VTAKLLLQLKDVRVLVVDDKECGASNFRALDTYKRLTFEIRAGKDLLGNERWEEPDWVNVAPTDPIWIAFDLAKHLVGFRPKDPADE
jgi:hypothetical protein